MTKIKNTTGSPRTLLGEGVRVDIPANGTASVDAKAFGVLKRNKHVRALFEIGHLEEVGKAKSEKPKSKKDVGI